MTIAFRSYINRTGLDYDESQKVDSLTSNVQDAMPWKELQVQFRSSGFKKEAKAEAALILINNEFRSNSDNNERLILLKAAVSVLSYYRQENLLDNFKKHNWDIPSDLIDENKDILESQYLKSKELSEKKGFFARLLN